MRNLLIISLLLLTSLTQAACFEYELVGEGEMTEDRVLFVVARGTQSEVRLSIPNSQQDLFFPYINRIAKTRLITDRSSLNFSTKVVKVISIYYEIPDPLNLSSTTSVKKIREVKCH